MGVQIPHDVLAGLQESLARDQKQAADNTALQRSALQQRLAALRNRMDRAYQDRLEAKISEDFPGMTVAVGPTTHEWRNKKTSPKPAWETG